MHPVRIALASICAATSLSAHALVTVWDGASNLMPDEVDANWVLTDEGGGSPSLADGVLTIQTSGTHSARQFYQMTATDFSGGAPFWMEAEMKFVSGSQTAGWWRAGGHMSIRNNGKFAILEIRNDLIYLRDGDNSRSVQAVVDTNDDFHLYRLEVLGNASDSLVNVYQDGNLVLSDASLYGAAASGGSVTFGEASTLATGTTLWRRVSHNVAAVAVVPEPETYALMLAGLGLVTLSLRRRT